MSNKLLDKFMDGGDVSPFYSQVGSMINDNVDVNFDGGDRKRKRRARQRARQRKKACRGNSCLKKKTIRVR